MQAKTGHKLGMDGERWKSEFQEWMRAEDLRVEAAEVIDMPVGVYMEKIYFVGANVLFCTQGAFRFSFPDRPDVTLREGEVLVVFARRFVTIEATDPRRANVLAFAIVAGDFANEYMSKLGFFSYFHAPCSYPEGSFLHLQDILARKDTREGDAKTEALCLFNSIMCSIFEEVRMNGDTAFYDAVKVINRNIMDGKARVQPVCDQLRVSRTQLHRIFARNGFESVGAFIKDTQLQYALKLLRVSDFKVAAIAKQLGFTSQSNFTAFVRQRTGKSPLQLRGTKGRMASDGV